jgi:hypothetical protein
MNRLKSKSIDFKNVLKKEERRSWSREAGMIATHFPPQLGSYDLRTFSLFIIQERHSCHS